MCLVFRRLDKILIESNVEKQVMYDRVIAVK